MGDQEKKRPLLIMFDAISDDDDGEIYDMAVMGGIWKELILAARKLPDDDFSDFTPPTKKVKENAIINSSLSISRENTNSNSNNDKISNEKRKQNKKSRDRDKERNSSSNSSSGSKKDRDKHKSTSREKEKTISSSNKEKERERHKSKSKEKERDKKSTSKDRETEKHNSSSKDKEKNTSSSKDNERDRKITSKDRETEKINTSSKDKERDKTKKSIDRENEKERSRSFNRENEKEKYVKTRNKCDLDSESIIKIEEKNNYEKKDTIKNISKERSPDRNQGSNKNKSQDKFKETSNTIEESEVNCNIIEKNGNAEDDNVIKVCPEDIKCNKNIVNDMASKSTKGDKIFNSIPVSIGPLTSTQKSTPERRKPKERLTVEEKVFQRELEAALNISKMDVTADTESLKLEENEVEVEKFIDPGSSNEVKSEEMKVPKLILKVKTDQIMNKISDKNKINNENNKYYEPETSLKEDKGDIPVYEIKKDESCQKLKAENENIQTIKDEKTKIDSINISITTNNAETHSAENLSASNKMNPLSKDANMKTDKIDLMYKNPKPSTSTGFISGKRQRKTVVFKEESDSEDDDFSVQSDSEDSNFEISPIKKFKDESKASISKPAKKETKKMGIKGDKIHDKKETPEKENEKTKRISPRTRRTRNLMIVGSDSDSEEFKKIKIDTLNKKDDMKENDHSIGKSLTPDRNKTPEKKRRQKNEYNGNDKSDEDFECDSNDSEFKSSPEKKTNPTSKEKKNKTLVEKKESNEKSKTVLNTKNLPSNTDSVNSVLKPSIGNSTKLNNTIKLANSTKLNNTIKLANSTPTRSIGMIKSAVPVKSFTPVIIKPLLSSTPARVSTGLVKTPFRSPLLNTSPNTSNSMLRFTTTEVRSSGLRIGLSRSTGFKPLHPNLKK